MGVPLPACLCPSPRVCAPPRVSVPLPACLCPSPRVCRSVPPACAAPVTTLADMSMHYYYLTNVHLHAQTDRPKSKECDLKKLSPAMKKVLYKNMFSRRGKDYRSEVAATGARDTQTQRKKRNRKKRKKQKRDRTLKTRSKCTECKCAARTSLHGWARGMCMTHAIENRLEIPQIKKNAKGKKPMHGAVKKEHVEHERVRQKKSKKCCKPLGSDADTDLDSDTQKEHDEEDLHEGTEFDEPQVEMKKEQNVPVKVKKEPKTKEKPNLRKLEVERNSNAKAERQWPKGVRICLGSLPLQRIPTRERCHGGNSQASATQQNCARVASLTRTCQSVNGCGHIFCDECFPM